ncbi:MAG: class I SAM-dependent methyltransferase [Candidatus Zixiibacteriota bacterium]
MARKLDVNIELFCATSEALPFEDEVFDVVSHVAGINYFNDKGEALREMVRVTRPGTKMIVVDETEEFAKRVENTPGASDFYKNRKGKIAMPVDLLPPDLIDVKVCTIARGDLYCLSFRKSF